ncbi:MAG: bifunctional 3,4-dihydroxy-2-butanone-4-phosphate synthase/GTP cyclohydrolase II, partial [Rhizobium sp.]
LAKKIAAYGLQDEGLDTLDANQALGLPPDMRRYDAAAAILRDLGLRNLKLLTNNPAKLEALRAAGIVVSSRQSLIAASSVSNISYLQTKRERFGHLLDEGSSREDGSDAILSTWAARMSAGPLG